MTDVVAALKELTDRQTEIRAELERVTSELNEELKAVTDQLNEARFALGLPKQPSNGEYQGKKRGRRTKAEIEAARLAAAPVDPDEQFAEVA